MRLKVIFFMCNFKSFFLQGYVLLKISIMMHSFSFLCGNRNEDRLQLNNTRFYAINNQRKTIYLYRNNNLVLKNLILNHYKIIRVTKNI